MRRLRVLWYHRKRTGFEQPAAARSSGLGEVAWTPLDRDVEAMGENAGIGGSLSAAAGTDRP